MDFLNAEAEESDVSDSDVGSDSDAEAQRKKKQPKKKKMTIVDDDEDDEEEEDDEEQIREEMKDLINDEEEEEEEDENEEETKRKHEDSDMDDRLEEEDYELIEENLGIKVDRRHKRKRIKVVSDDEDSDKEEEEEEGHDRQAIANELFEGEEEEGEIVESPVRPQEVENEFGDLEETDEEDLDNFIVDEEGQPIRKGKKKKHIIHSDRALQEAQDIFGVDFDFEEFDQYGDEDEEEEEFVEEEIEEEEEGVDGERRKVTKKVRKKPVKKSIYEVFEPSELERGHFTDQDNAIRMADIPERFQLRGIPVQPTEEGELEEEADWIFKNAFVTPTISKQIYMEHEGHAGNYSYYNKRESTIVNKIKEAINFMRNQLLEVPFIAFYRKEYVEPDLNINDLWKIWHWDEKWTRLKLRKQNLVKLFEKMQNYQYEFYSDPDKILESNIRTLTEEDVERLKKVKSMEELKDVYQHFLLYYGQDVPKMRKHEKQKKKNELEENGETAGDEEEQHDIKQASRKSGYTICLQAKLDEIARKFGLQPEQFGENLRDNYQRHDVEQFPIEPVEDAKEYICSQFATVEDVLMGARHIVAVQIAHDPLVRQCVREVYYERARFKVFPTKKGLKVMDEAHPCYTMKFLKDKSVKDLRDDQYLRLTQAEEEGLLKMEMYIDEEALGAQTYFEEIRQLYYRDEFSHLVQQWNLQRCEALERALTKIIYPQLSKELHAKLLQEAKEGITKACCRKLYHWLKVAPYQADQQLEDDYDYDETNKGLKVLGVAFSTSRDDAQFAAFIDGDGQVTDFLKMTYLTSRKNHWQQKFREGKQNDMEKLKELILTKKPHVVCVSAESRMSSMVIEDIKELIIELEQEEQIAPINVELVDNELSIIYENSNMAQFEFREYPPVLRHAISVARRLQDPLIEFSRLCNADEDILCLKYHQLQDSVSKEELLNALHLEFVNRVNEVGVDINRAINFHHTGALVQFICGLGPRKGSHLLRVLKQNNCRFENRTQLVTLPVCHMGPKVFINCAGFIKIDTNSLGDSTESYVEVLDGSRIHPETYDWARKMAVDALEYDDTAEDANPAGALEEILESPERLKDLDLDAFAEELERQGYGDKHITLYDIRAELNHRYKDLRTPYRPPTNEERFNMLTKETPETFYVGKLVLCSAYGIQHRRPKADEYDQANPVRDEETGFWECPFCHKNNFPELSEVWGHFDGGSCPGSAVGVKVRLDNGVTGFIHTKMISDKRVKNPEERIKVGMTVHARITKIDIDRFQVELTCRSSDLQDKDGLWRPPKDLYYDVEAEKALMSKEEEKQKQKARQTYIKRVILHPSFQNIGYTQCEKIMSTMDQGEVIIRPSSKGSDHLTVTWKLADDCLSHIDVKEEGKENIFSIGKSLWIGNEEFEDLDEIIARHVQPMAAFARDLLNFKYYKDDKKEVVDKILMEEKKKQPSRIPYFIIPAKQYPGKYILSYLPRTKSRHEYISITPEGIRYRNQTFHSLNSLVRWFKEHFRDPIPGTPGSARTPMVPSNYNTPSINLSGVDAATIQRAAAGLPSNIYNTLAQVAGATPQFGSSSNYAGYSGQYNYQPTPVGTTPMVTPSFTNRPTTPGQPLTTPSYQPTPRGGWMGATPRHGYTPRPGGVTPRSTAVTPRQGGVTPRAGATTPRTTPRTPSHRSNTQAGGSAATDWAKMAELWANRNRRAVTPKSGQSPAVQASPRGTPRGGNTPRGDSTPLIDER